jgi:hypothetical protein
MGTAPQSATTRTVVLLRPAERKRLEKLAASEQVSSGEILRRSLRSYDRPSSAAEEETIGALLIEMNTALDSALVSIRTARSEIQENLKKIEAMKEAAR